MTARPPAVGTWLLERAGVDDALVGDLEEQFARNRCVLWFWRQVALSIVSIWIDTLRSHKLLALRAIITGWVTWALLFVGRQMLTGEIGSGEWAFTVDTIIRYGNWLVIGWVIGMLHRPYQASMVLAYVLFMLVMSLPFVSRLASLAGHPFYNAPSASMVALASISLIIGGLLSAATARNLHRPNPQRPSQPAIG